MATHASVDMWELVFKQVLLKTILTHPLRNTLPKIVMYDYTKIPAVHGKSFHKGDVYQFVTYSVEKDLLKNHSKSRIKKN